MKLYTLHHSTAYKFTIHLGCWVGEISEHPAHIVTTQYLSYIKKWIKLLMLFVKFTFNFKFYDT